MHYLTRALSQPRSGGGGGGGEGSGKKSSVLLLGGRDAGGPALWAVDGQGAAPVSFAALGSGSTDALAVLELELHRRRRKDASGRSRGEGATPPPADDDDEWKGLGGAATGATAGGGVPAALTVAEGVRVVRAAVRAGVLNDLGSGSHIDLCTLHVDGRVELWREMGQEPMPRAVAASSLLTSGVDADDDDIGTLIWASSRRQTMTPKIYDVDYV